MSTPDPRTEAALKLWTALIRECISLVGTTQRDGEAEIENNRFNTAGLKLITDALTTEAARVRGECVGKWSTARPTRAGFWFYRYDFLSVRFVYRVYEANGALLVSLPHEMDKLVSGMDGQWSSAPIAEPREI